MKKLINRYQISKFKCFINGLLFAIIALIAIRLCMIEIWDRNINKADILIPFIIAVVSIVMGFISMFHTNIPAKKIKHS